MKSLYHFIQAKTIAVLLLLTATLALTSCAGDSYYNAIPHNSNAIVSVDVATIAERVGETRLKLLQTLIGVDNQQEMGVDLAERVFLFETPDGDFGLCAKVADDSKLRDWLEKMAGKGLCGEITEKYDAEFTSVKGTFVLGFNDDALLAIGPVLPAQQADAMRRIGKYLKQDADHSIAGTPLFDRLDTESSLVSLVARMDALPEAFAAPFTIGAPDNVDASQLLTAASLNITDGGVLSVSGETFSPNASIDKALKSGVGQLRPIRGDYLSRMPADAAFGIFMNVDGRQLVEMLHNNKSLGMLLEGVNTAIDMDNILRSVDGDLAISVPAMNDDAPQLAMLARLRDSKFLSDVDYWRESCHEGAGIDKLDGNYFDYHDGDSHLFFGVSNNVFFASTNNGGAKWLLHDAGEKMPAQVINDIRGKRMAMVVSLKGILRSAGIGMLTGVLPLLGDIDTVVYSVK